MMKSYFEMCKPEEVGIRSEGIMDFLADVSGKGIEQHSLMIIRHGRCAAQGWWEPYGPEYLHPIYSFSKSLTAVAVGFAEQEGLLSLEEKLIDIFPDKLPAVISDELKEINLHHLLTMSCGHETECEPKGTDWIREFLAHPVLHRPGTFYKYNTMGTNMLCAVLFRKTGQNVTQFLKARLFEPLGIDRIVCATMPDEDHIEHGGGGMKLTTEEMARFAYFCLHKGSWEGKQLLSADWFDRMSAKQIETAGDSEGHVKEWANGYGYQCWMGSLPGSYRADGAYGQFGFIYPSLDLIVVMTSATEQTQSLVDSMMQYLIPAVTGEVLPPSDQAAMLERNLGRLHLPHLCGDRMPSFEQELTGQNYISASEETSCSLDILIGGSGLFDLHSGSITQMSFTCADNVVMWKVWEEEQISEIAIPLSPCFVSSQTHGHLYAASGRWRSARVLEAEIRRLDALSGVRLIFRFDGDMLYIEADETLITAGTLGMNPKQLVPFVRLGE